MKHEHLQTKSSPPPPLFSACVPQLSLSPEIRTSLLPFTPALPPSPVQPVQPVSSLFGFRIVLQVQCCGALPLMTYIPQNIAYNKYIQTCVIYT